MMLLDVGRMFGQRLGKKQPTVAQSTCEAEFIGANVGYKEALCYANMLKEIGMPVDGGYSYVNGRISRDWGC